MADYLRGDATVNGIKRKLQSTLSNAFEGNSSLRILSELGISTQKDGTLLLNGSKLESNLSTKFGDTVKCWPVEGSTDGVMKKFNTLLLDMTSTSGGMYADKKNSYDRGG